MKLKMTTTEYVRKDIEIECNRYIQVPGWVWPFSCDGCGADITEDKRQIVCAPEGTEDIYHFHVECFNRVKKEN